MKKNSYSLDNTFHIMVFEEIRVDILIIFLVFLTNGIQKKYQKKCLNIHQCFFKNHHITGNYYMPQDIPLVDPY